MPVIADLLLQFVDTSAPFDARRGAQDAQAVVILGGGVRRDAPEYGGDTLATLTLERVRYGARVARLTGLPVLVSGGSVLGGEPEAKLMAASLEREFGVPVRWVETRSRTTHENAVLSARIAEEATASTASCSSRMASTCAGRRRIRGAGPRRRRRADRANAADARPRCSTTFRAWPVCSGSYYATVRDSRQSGPGRASEPLRTAMTLCAGRSAALRRAAVTQRPDR